MGKKYQKAKSKPEEITKPADSWKMPDKHFALITFFMSLLVYLLTTSRSVQGGDSGELIGAAATLGVAHPPGFPLYVLTGFLFSKIPVLSPALALNIHSAVFGAGAVSLLAMAVLRVTNSQLFSLLAAVLFGLSPLTWLYHTQAEVFALNNFFVAGLLLWSATFLTSPQKASLWVLALLLSLGLTNHHIFIFFAGPLATWLFFIQQQRKFTTDEIKKALLIFGAGFLVYLQIPLSSHAQKYFSWGEPVDFSGFVHHFLRKDYGTFQLAAGAKAGDFMERVLFFARTLSLETFGTIILLLTFLKVKKQELRSLPYAWFISLLSYVVVFSYLANTSFENPANVIMFERFSLQALLVASFLIVINLWSRLKSKNTENISTITVGLLIFAVCFQSVRFLPEWRATDQKAFGIFAKNILENLPAGALLLTEGDHITNPVRYSQTLEGIRRDVGVLDIQMLRKTWYVNSVKKHISKIIIPGASLKYGNDNQGDFTLTDLINANIGSRQIYVANSFRGLDQTSRMNYWLWPQGLVERLLPVKEFPEPQDWFLSAEKAFTNAQEIGKMKYEERRWSFLLPLLYWIGREKFAFRLLDLYEAQKANSTILPKAAEILEEAKAKGPDPSPIALKVLGKIYHLMIPTNASMREKRDQVWHEYLDLAFAKTDPDAEGLRRLLNQAN